MTLPDIPESWLAGKQTNKIQRQKIKRTAAADDKEDCHRKEGLRRAHFVTEPQEIIKDFPYILATDLEISFSASHLSYLYRGICVQSFKDVIKF